MASIHSTHLQAVKNVRFPQLGKEYRTLKILFLCRISGFIMEKTGAERTSEQRAVNGRRAWHRELGGTGFAWCLGPPYPRQPHQRRLLRLIPILSIARPHPMRQTISRSSSSRYSRRFSSVGCGNGVNPLARAAAASNCCMGDEFPRKKKTKRVACIGEDAGSHREGSGEAQREQVGRCWGQIITQTPRVPRWKFFINLPRGLHPLVSGWVLGALAGLQAW